jgi:hypothetical protein
MSQFYDLASLVVIPSGYKASTIYAQKPLTTDGQLSFTRASTATRVNASGLIEAVSSNVPRLDYTNSSCPRLLLEPQRTNLNPYSEQFDNADWEKTNSTITANATASPDGYTNADAWLETSASGQHRLYDNGISVTAATAYTCSLFVKANGRSWVSIEFFAVGGGFNGSRVWFNISNGTIGTTQTGITAKIDNYGNGWYRIQATQNAASTTTGYILYHLATADGATTYAGDVTKGAFVYGGMTEAGAYATSYIPTLAASATRVADAASKTGISSLIGQTEGTAFIECTVDNTNSNGAMLIYLGSSDGGGAFNYSTYLKFDGSALNLVVYSGGTDYVNSVSSQTYVNNQTLKVAFAYKANDFVCYANGVQLFTDTSGTVSTNLSSVSYGSYPLNIPFNQYNGKISQALLFKTRLTNAEMAELTTL